jgi:hypothetical protein
MPFYTAFRWSFFDQFCPILAELRDHRDVLTRRPARQLRIVPAKFEHRDAISQSGSESRGSRAGAAQWKDEAEE